MNSIIDPRRVRPGLLAAVLLAAVLAFALPSAVQDEDAALTRWVLKGELTSVLARGNSEAFTFGVGATARRRWGRDALRLEAGGIRVETGSITRRATGTPGDFSVVKDVMTEKTAESVFAKARYDRTLSDRLFLYAGADWLRNTFAGIDSRTVLAAGGGNTFADDDRTRFATTYAVTYTFQQDVVENPDVDSDFAGLRLGYELSRQISESSLFESAFVGDQNLQETDDRRFDLTNSLTVDVNDVIALKPSLQILWRNLPSLTDVPLFGPGGVDTGTVVQTPLDKVDVFFRLALVLTL